MLGAEGHRRRGRQRRFRLSAALAGVHRRGRPEADRPRRHRLLRQTAAKVDARPGWGTIVGRQGRRRAGGERRHRLALGAAGVDFVQLVANKVKGSRRSDRLRRARWGDASRRVPSPPRALWPVVGAVVFMVGAALGPARRTGDIGGGRSSIGALARPAARGPLAPVGDRFGDRLAAAGAAGRARAARRRDARARRRPYQGVFRNPLVDPYLLGVAAGAGLGRRSRSPT